MSEGQSDILPYITDQITKSSSKSLEFPGYTNNGIHDYHWILSTKFDGFFPDGEQHFFRLLEQIKEKKGSVAILDIGAARNELLRSLCGFPFIQGHAISLGDPRQPEEEQQDRQLGIEYEVISIDEFQPKEKFDVVFCLQMLIHHPHSLQILQKVYDLTADNGYIYADWDPQAGASRITWTNGSFTDVIEEWKARGIQIRLPRPVKGYTRPEFIIQKTPDTEIPIDFIVQSEPVLQKILEPWGSKIRLESTYSLVPDKMKTKDRFEEDSYTE